MRLRVFSAVALFGGSAAAFQNTSPTRTTFFVPSSSSFLGSISTSVAEQSSSFTSSKGTSFRRNRVKRFAAEEPSVCSMPDAQSVNLASSNVLRKAVLTTATGDKISLGNVMGQGTYAKQLCELELPDNVAGPFFVSIGDAAKLETFLELNPFIPRDKAFVDDYDMDAYRAMGFGKFTDLDPKDAKKLKMTAPELDGFGGWWNYLSNSVKLAPIPNKNEKVAGIPPGVLQLGGTFVIDGDEVVYQWNDKVPGDTPDLNGVLEIVKDHAAAAE